MFNLSRTRFDFGRAFTALLIAVLALGPYAQNGLAQPAGAFDTTGTISGQVKDGVGTALGNMPVNLDGPGIGLGACTNGSGNYTFTGVPLGVALMVEAVPIGQANRCGGSNSYANQYWNQKASWQTADTITLTAASLTRTGIDFALAPGGGVSGHVYRANGATPVTDSMLLFSYPSTGQWNFTGKWGSTGSNGSFEVWGFPVGPLYALTSANWNGSNPDLVDEWYAPGGSVVDSSQAVPVTVTTGVLQTGIDFQLDPGGAISGQVKAAVGGATLENMPVNLDGPTFGRNTCTDSTGSYTFAQVPLGVELRVEAVPVGESNRCGGSNAYANQFWNQKAGWGAADVITLTAASPNRTDIHFALAPGGGMSGHIYRADGSTPVVDAGLMFTDAATGKFNVTGKWGNTGSDGSFTVWGFPLGPVYVRTCATCGGKNPNLIEEWYAPGGSVADGSQASPVTITQGVAQPGIDFQLDLGGTISGQVKAAVGGATLENIPVNLDGPATGMGACTDATGNYTFSGVALNVAWRVEAVPFGETNRCGGSNSYANQFWNNKTSWDAADLITLTEANLTQTGVDFALAPGGGISGHIYRADGTTPVVNAGLIFADAATGSYHITGKWGNTGSDGSFTVWGFPLGPVYVRTCANCGDQNPNLIEEWYAPGGSVVDGSLASPVTITAGVAQPGIDFQLDLALKKVFLPVLRH